MAPVRKNWKKSEKKGSKMTKPGETASRAIRYEIKLSQALFQFVGRGLGLSLKQGFEKPDLSSKQKRCKSILSVIP